MQQNTLPEKDLYMLRGLPGAGKSCLAKSLAQQRWPVYSVDDFFTNPVTGHYEFHYEQNHLAYKACEHNTERAMQQHIAKIFVDNTFTMGWEMEPYFALAKKYGYRLFVLTVENYHSGRNIHGVSPEQIQKMADKYAVKLYWL